MFSKSCLKFNFEQLSHSMSVRNIAPSYGCYGKRVSLATAKRAIFVTGMLWESCSKSHFKQVSHTVENRSNELQGTKIFCYRQFFL